MGAAIIENNRPKCPLCDEKEKLKVIDVDVALLDGVKFFEILIRCNSCNRESYYFLDTEMKKRLSANKKDGSYKKSIEG